MGSKIKLDEIDRHILRLLVSNARTPFTEIAKKLIISPGTVHVRYKKMEEMGLITGASININYNKIGYTFVAYLGIILTKSSYTPSVLAYLKKIPNITVANLISGRYGVLCKIRARDTIDAKEIIFKINEIEGVLRTESIISLEEQINDKSPLLNSVFS